MEEKIELTIDTSYLQVDRSDALEVISEKRKELGYEIISSGPLEEILEGISGISLLRSTPRHDEVWYILNDGVLLEIHLSAEKFPINYVEQIEFLDQDQALKKIVKTLEFFPRN